MHRFKPGEQMRLNGRALRIKECCNWVFSSQGTDVCEFGGSGPCYVVTVDSRPSAHVGESVLSPFVCDSPFEQSITSYIDRELRRG